MIPLLLFDCKRLNVVVVGVAAAAILCFSSVAADTVPVEDVASALTYNDHGKLGQHVLLYTAACQQAGYLQGLEYPVDYFDVRPTTDVRLWRDYTQTEPTDASLDEGCHAVCLERGVDQSVAHAVMPHKQYHDNNKDQGGSRAAFHTWFRDECVQVEVCFMNYYSPQIQSYWIHPRTQQRVEHVTIPFGERHTKCFHSFIGHVFDLVDAAATNDDDDNPPDGHNNDAPLIATVTIEHVTTRAFGTAPPSAEYQENEPLETKVRRALLHEWNRHQAVTRTFSPLGFQKGRLPDDVFAMMGAFYYNNRHNKVLEEWTGRGIFVNWWESNVNFIQIPWRIKTLWQARLLDMVQTWAGVPVEQTVMYGLRQYEHGARLLTHVDRERTHAVSLIVNIAQGNLTSDWPVEVHDHADRLHEVTMAPGDVVYYESAKCLHGRNRPLAGQPGHDAYYVNLFTHYRPTGDDGWLTRPNPPGTPQPVLETDGQCHRRRRGDGGGGGAPEPEADSDDSTGTLDSTEYYYVECDDPRLGPYLSPALFTAHNGEDLLEWWRQTSPSPPSSQAVDSTVGSHEGSDDEL